MSNFFYFILAISRYLCYNREGGINTMKLTKSGSKNSPTYYVQKSIWINDKSTTKTVERLGSLEELKARAGDKDPIEWANEYVKKLTLAEKESKKDITIKYSGSRQIDKNVRKSVNAGYLFLKKIYNELKLPKLADEISEKYKITYDLDNIFSSLLYTRILSPSSKEASFHYSENLLEKRNFELHQVYRALEVLAKENDLIQKRLYGNSLSVIERKKHILYYDCTNFYFETEEEDEFRKYGISKEHRPNPIVQMGLFMDADGIPLAFSMFPGNQNEQPSLAPLEKKVISDFGIDKLVVCTDSGLSSTANRRFNDTKNRKFITTQSIKKLKGFLKEFCLSDEGWKKAGSRKTYKISELDPVEDCHTTFYKDRWINEDGLEQHLIITFSLKYRAYQRKIRGRQIEKASSSLDHPSILTKRSANDYKRLLSEEHITRHGEIAEKSLIELDMKKIAEEERYDGFYAVCTNLDDNAEAIVRINHKRWEIEECFRIMKTEFKARPVYLSREDRIKAHFLTCYASLVLYRILEKRLTERFPEVSFSCHEIIQTLRNMNMLVSPGDGYIPVYERTDLTDALHEISGFRTDLEIVSNRNMKRIFTMMKKEEK